MTERHEDARLSAFLDDELDDDDALVVTRHLARCDRCLAELESLRETRSAVRRLPEVDPPAAVFLNIAAQTVADLALRRRRILVAGFAALLLALAAYTLGNRPGGVLPTVDPLVVEADVPSGDGSVITPVSTAP